jgi:integrase
VAKALFQPDRTPTAIELLTFRGRQDFLRTKLSDAEETARTERVSAAGQFGKPQAALPERLRPLIRFLYYCSVRVGEGRKIRWEQVDLRAALIRLEDEHTKTGEARTVPIPDVLIAMLHPIESKEGVVFDSTNLPKEWMKACAAVGLGTISPGKNKYDQRHSGLIIHDLRRWAIKSPMAAGVSEKAAMTIGGHRARSVFHRSYTVDTADVQNAMRRGENLAPIGTNMVKMLPPRRT